MCKAFCWHADYLQFCLDVKQSILLFQINRSSWHIPRASLSGSTSSNSAHSNKSHSNASSVKYPARTRRPGGHKNRGYLSDGEDRSTIDIAKHPSGVAKYDATTGGVKRSSQSSQGSTDSNHSSHVSKREESHLPIMDILINLFFCVCVCVITFCQNRVLHPGRCYWPQPISSS